MRGGVPLMQLKEILMSKEKLMNEFELEMMRRFDLEELYGNTRGLLDELNKNFLTQDEKIAVHQLLQNYCDLNLQMSIFINTFTNR